MRATRKQLEDINYLVNRKVTYKEDIQQYGKIEYWDPAVTFGDCEDYALAKRQMLYDAGIDPDSIHLVYCLVKVDGVNEGHAVLLVQAEDSDYILDNRFHWVVPPNDSLFVDYTWKSWQVGNQWFEMKI